MINIKRYLVTVQHEVIIYDCDPERAKETACKAYAKAECIHISELPPLETEALKYVIIDHRTAPGS